MQYVPESSLSSTLSSVPSADDILSLYRSLSVGFLPEVTEVNSFSHDFGVFAIEFLPAWLSLRMRLSSPDHSPLIARTRVLATMGGHSHI